MKLGLKLLAAPLFTALVLSLAGQVNVLLVSRAGASSLSRSQASLDDVKTIASAQQQLGQLHAWVYRTVSVIGANDADKKAKDRQEFAIQLDGIKRVTAGLADSQWADATLQASVADLEAQIDRYKDQVDATIGASLADPEMLGTALQSTDAAYASLSQNMEAVVAKIENISDTAITASADRTHKISVLLMAVAALSACIAVWLSWLMQRALVAELGSACNLANAVANGELHAISESQRSDELGDLQRALARMTRHLNQSIRTVRDSSESVLVASGEIAHGNQDLSLRTEQTASNLQSAAASIEQLTAAVKQSAASAHEANQLALSAAAIAGHGRDIVLEVIATMENIHASAKRITDIIGVIDGIAFQTNILALNAAVEAARAGAQGRGFAVVAGEVRSLSGHSARAAKEIKGLIGDSVAKVDSGSRLVADAGRTMQQILDSVSKVSGIIEEVSRASSEQSQGILQVNETVAELDQMTQQNAALVEQSAAAAASLKDQAHRLSQVVSIFRLGHGRTLEAIAITPTLLVAA